MGEPSLEAPKWYFCDSCGLRGVRLWRHDIFSMINVACVDCATRDSKEVLVDHPERLTDSRIGYYFPAIPSVDGHMHAGLDPVEDCWVEWWKCLPERKVEVPTDNENPRIVKYGGPKLSEWKKDDCTCTHCSTVFLSTGQDLYYHPAADGHPGEPPSSEYAGVVCPLCRTFLAVELHPVTMAQLKQQCLPRSQW